MKSQVKFPSRARYVVYYCHSKIWMQSVEEFARFEKIDPQGRKVVRTFSLSVDARDFVKNLKLL